MKDTNEKQLVLKLTYNNDPDAFAELYDLYAPKIYRFIYFKVGTISDAQDLTSEVFLKAWGSTRERSDEIKNFRAFLYAIARNTIVDYYRSRQQATSLEEVDHELFIRETNLEQLSDAADLYTILKALTGMKDEYREAIIFRFMDDMSYREISQITGKSAVNVRVIVHRALKALKAQIDQK